MKPLTEINNLHESLISAPLTPTGVTQASLQIAGDYELSIVEIPPLTHQKAHYHTYGDMDIFIMVSGQGVLRLAAIENQKIVPGSEETYNLSPGDTYRLAPFVLHGIENTGDTPLIFFNMSPASHTVPVQNTANNRLLVTGYAEPHVVDLYFPEQQ